MFIFSNWLKQLNTKFTILNRKILLLVENCPGHKLSEETMKQITHVKVEFLRQI